MTAIPDPWLEKFLRTCDEIERQGQRRFDQIMERFDRLEAIIRGDDSASRSRPSSKDPTRVQ